MRYLVITPSAGLQLLYFTVAAAAPNPNPNPTPNPNPHLHPPSPSLLSLSLTPQPQPHLHSHPQPHPHQVAAAASALQLASGGASTVPTSIARAVHILYQIVVQTSLLVTCVVTFVLLPTRLRRRDMDGARYSA